MGQPGKETHMEYRTFKEEFKKRMQRELGKGMELSFLEVEKNNGASYEGMEVRETGDSVSAILPMEELYHTYLESGMCQAAESAQNMLLARAGVLAEAVPMDWKSAKGQVRPMLIHYGWNRERLGHMPHQRFLDLAVAYRVELTLPGGFHADVAVKDTLLEAWGIKGEELHKAAMGNLGEENYRVQPMSELLEGMIGTTLELPEDALGQYVLFQESCCYGAAGILRKDIMESFAERTGGNFYILPSSIHEVILMPESPSISVEELKETVKEVNETEVAREERLSENVYYYDCETREVKIGE